jgi:hypothetical protein
MDVLEFTLVSEGSSDRVLVPILEWLLRQRVRCGVQGDWADLRRAEPAPRSLGDKVRRAIEEYPCHLLCVHRDADRGSRDDRVREIRAALAGIENPPAVCVVPVRMTEAWLLVDEAALREAAGYPSGKMPLAFPGLGVLESLPNPKGVLHELLMNASGFKGRRLQKFRPEEAMHRLVNLIRDYSCLRQLAAFRALEQELREVLASPALEQVCR